MAVAVAVVLNESKRQALHDQRANARVNRRLAYSQRQREQAERLALLGKLAAAMAHEINNPLAFTMANLRFVAGALPRDGGPDATEVADALAESQEGLARIQAIVERMGAFRSSGRPAEYTTDVRAALERIVEGFGLSAELRSRLSLELPAPLPAITLDELRLSRVLRALVTNALEAARSRVTLRAEVVAKQLELHVEDDGPGVAAELLPNLFEPFATAGGNGKLGLSLVLARELTRSVGGDLRVANRTEGGARFTVELPLAGA